MENKTHLLELIKSRRSIMPNQYNASTIKDEEINLILEAANWAPTHKKTEPWRFKVLKNKTKNDLGKFLADKYKESNTNFSDNIKNFNCYCQTVTVSVLTQNQMKQFSRTVTLEL